MAHDAPLALRDGEGRVYVGPDNGLLIPAAEKLGGIAEAHELANPEYALESVSRTFHGRDLFAPAAAHLALGVPLARARAADRSGCARSSRHPAARGRHDADPLTVLSDRPLREHRAQPRPLHTSKRPASCPGHASSCRSVPSVTTPSLRGRSPTRGRATSSSTRTPTGTSRSPSTAAMPLRCSAISEGQEHSHPPGAVVNRRTLGQKFARLATNAVSAQPVSVAVLPAARSQAVRRDCAGSGTRCAIGGHVRTVRGSARCCRAEAAQGARPRNRDRARARSCSRGSLPDAEIVGADLAERCSSRQAQRTPAELANRVRFERADASALPYGDGSFELVDAREHDPVLRRGRARTRTWRPGAVRLLVRADDADLRSARADARRARTAWIHGVCGVRGRSRGSRCLPASREPP